MSIKFHFFYLQIAFGMNSKKKNLLSNMRIFQLLPSYCEISYEDEKITKIFSKIQNKEKEINNKKSCSLWNRSWWRNIIFQWLSFVLRNLFFPITFLSTTIFHPFWDILKAPWDIESLRHKQRIQSYNFIISKILSLHSAYTYLKHLKWQVKC